MHRRVHRSWLPILAALLAVIVILPTLAQETDASQYRWTAKCDVKVRTWHTTTAKVLRVIKAGATVRTDGAVEGQRWSANCNGYAAGRMWLRIVAISGCSRFGGAPSSCLKPRIS